MNLSSLIDKILSFSSEDEFCLFIKENFEEIQEVFKGTNYEELYSGRFKLSDLFYDIQNTLLRNDEQEINAFKNILADFFERFSLAAEVQSLCNILGEGPVKKRLQAALLYLRINDVNEFSINFPIIIQKLNEAYEEEDFPKKLNLSLANYFYCASKYLNQSHSHILDAIKIQFIENALNIPFLSNDLLKQIEKGIITESDIRNYINDSESNIIESLELGIINDYEIERSEYAEHFLKYENYTFEDIINLNRQLLPENLYEKLGRGTDIIEDPNLLLQYIKSYGKMHNCKLIDAFDVIDFVEFENKKIEIIDWGSGQAVASFLFMEYFSNSGFKIDIRSIKLIEPSEHALKRGLLHLNKWRSAIKIVPVHKDFDTLTDSDLISSDGAIKIHLFSNILDVPMFNLKDLIAKIKKTQAKINYFICISPFIDDNKNMRIEAFFNNFNDNYDTILVSERKNSKNDEFWNCSNTYNNNQCNTHSDYGCCKKWTRYEKIFKTNIIY